MDRQAIGGEVAKVFCAMAAATWLVSLTGTGPLAEYGQLALAAAFLGTALTMARRTGGALTHGIALGGLLAPPEDGSRGEPGSGGELLRTLAAGLPSAAKELAVALGLAALIFPGFAWAFAWFHQAPGPLAWDPPPDLANLLLGQLVLIALPEEALFRGYVQTRLSAYWPGEGPKYLGGVRWQPLIAQAVLFALLHLFSGGGVARLAVFFPGLVFGWLRGMRGGIGAAVFFHALCNVYSELLTRGYW